MSRKFSTNFSNESLNIKFPVGWQACRAVLLSVSDYAYIHTYVHVHTESNRQAGRQSRQCLCIQPGFIDSIHIHIHIYIHCIFLFKRVKSTTTLVLGTYIYTHRYIMCMYIEREICFPEYLRTYVYAFMYLMRVDQSFIPL